MKKCVKALWVLFAALIVAFVTKSICNSTAVASGPTDTELRAVIRTWPAVRQIIEKGTPIRTLTSVHFLSGAREQPITEEQKQEIFRLARQADLWRDVWFVGIRNGLMSRRVTVYFVPDEVRAGLRRGRSVSFTLPNWPDSKRSILIEDYAQMEDGPLETFRPGVDNVPFRVASGLSLDEIAEVAHLVKVGPKPRSDEDGIANYFVRQRGRELRLDRSKPIMSMSQVGDVIKVETGVRHGGLEGSGQFIECKKSNGGWDVVNTALWVN